MAKKPRVQMPQSTAGLIRYYDQDSSTTLKFKPEQIFAVLIAIIAVELALMIMF